jgi:hypothetical protein
VYPVPAITDLANFSGRPQASYTGYAVTAMGALAQATVMFTFRTEVTDPSQFTGYNNITPADAQQLATMGICAMADYLYLRQPYQQAIASPLQNESIGSYSYSKPVAEMARNAAALEVTGEATGVPLFDLAVQMLARRTLAGGVFSGSISVFERQRDRDDRAQMWIRHDRETGQLTVLGPSDINQVDVPGFMDINAEVFPVSP